ncbi:MAG: 4a-hydroxytetrahydrobiopterin dehydratase [Actinobacteria bacterium]|nr:4a-hydroxytetrahydrobiopterin dehydratase [Actinomycetota bacterium]
MRYTPLDDGAARALPQLSEWTVQDGSISREFRLRSFAVIADFVRDVISTSDRLDHHPDIDIRWRRVRCALTTHDEGGLTDKDVALAREIDAAVETVS